MTSDSIKIFCEKIRLNKFGGAAEMVASGVGAIAEAARACEAADTAVFSDSMENDLDAILEVMPSIAPMTNLLHQFMGSIDRVREEKMELDNAQEDIAETVESYLKRQSNALQQIGFIGGQMIKDNTTVATYSTSGTVMGMFASARENGKRFKVVVSESRPANEGIRTMKETAEMGIPVTFGIDAILGTLLQGCAMFVVGADVITSNGDVLVKVGTYLGALVAREYNIPFYVAADTSKFDPMTLDGFPLKIRDKGADAVLTEAAPENVRVLNPSFELVPARLVTGIITEMGVIHPGNVAGMMHTLTLSPTLVKKLREWVNKPTRN